MKYLSTIILFISLVNCSGRSVNQVRHDKNATLETDNPILTGAEQTEEYVHLLQNKRLGLVVNQTSRIKGVHLVDSLLSMGLNVASIFAPEHGFRGTADAGASIQDGLDSKSGIPVVSIYGKNKKPSKESLANIDVIIFDIQDVGARFYTYISSMHYVMEACAESEIPLIILDRPNPNGNIVDGPVLDPEYRSFVGMHEVPVLHGMTIGEYALMIIGKGWLKNSIKPDVTIIKCRNYDHSKPYIVPVKPSPNLPNQRSIYLYPSLCFLEGTVMNAGRGTHKQFQVFGHPKMLKGDFNYIPESLPGARNPKLQGEICKGIDLSSLSTDSLFANPALNLTWLIEAYSNFPDKNKFFLENGFFEKLAGTDMLRKQIEAGLSSYEIKLSWKPALDSFREIREQYLLYPDNN